MGIKAAVIVMNVEVAQPGGQGFQPLHHTDFRAHMGVAHIQAQPEPGVIHPGGDIRHPLRVRFQHIFNAEHRVRRDALQKFLPEQNGLLRIPAGIVHMGQVSAVEHQSLGPVLLCHLERLEIAPGSQLPGQGVNGAGEELIEGAMEHPPLYALHLGIHPGFRFRVKRIHIDCGAVVRDFQAQAAAPGRSPCVFVYGG